MAVSKVLIANMALSHIGASSNIEALTESTANARECNLWYDHARQVALSRFDWNFARKRLTLATAVDDPADKEWVYRYQYPAGCLKLRYIENPAGTDADAVPYMVEPSTAGDAMTIMTDLNEAVGVYTWDLTNVALFSALFVDTMAYQLAHRVAYALTGKAAVKTKMLQLFNEHLLIANGHNANESVGRAPRDTDWIRARQ